MANFINKHRRGTTEAWSTSTVIPYEGEIVIEETSDGLRKLKVGDGVHTFVELPYAAQDVAEQLSKLEASSAKGLYYNEDNLLTLVNAEGEPIGNSVEIVGGNGSTTKVKLTNDNGSSAISAALGNPVLLKFTFTSEEDEVSTGKATCSITVDDIIRTTYSIEQGPQTADVSEYLRVGTNNVSITCTDMYGNYRTLVYIITVIELRLTSTFDSSRTYEEDITFRYVAHGLIEKTIHFVMDGVEIATDVIKDSGVADSMSLPEYPHGVHRLEVYATAFLNNETVESNHLLYDVMCVDAGNRQAMISSVYTITDVTQGDLVSIPYAVYDPNSLTADIELVVYKNEDGKLVEHSKQELTVDRAQQYWGTRNYPIGHAVFKIIYNYTKNEETGGWINQVSKTFELKVSEPNIDVEAETSDLELYLSSQGRSNLERDPATWTYKDITTTFTDFNWSSNGWVADSNGDACLRLNGDATAEIHIYPFEKDFKPSGKTIEFEFAVRDVNNRDAVIIDCMSYRDVEVIDPTTKESKIESRGIGIKATADTAYLHSLASSVSCNYKDNERIRVGFCVEAQDTGTRFVSIYLDGVLSGIVQYEDTDNFEQYTPVTIKLGSPYCGLDLYTVRIYNSALSAKQMLNNYIADMSDTGKKVSLFNENDLYNDLGKLSYTKLKAKLPTITFIGSMPTFKGDKKKDSVRMIFEHPDHPELNFDEILKQIDVQGTSSQFYVRKNWKVKTHNKKVHIPDMIPEKTFCIKVDYAEGTGTHNTQNANVVETLYSEKILPQNITVLDDITYGDERIRTTIQGYPVVLFQLDTNDENLIKNITTQELALRDDLYFSSKGNFNYDKDALEVFGFDNKYGAVECWEFCNNTSGPTNFTGEIDVTNYDEDFEIRYHPRLEELEELEDNKATEAVAALKQELIQNFKRLHDWIRLTNPDLATGEELTEPYTDYAKIVHTVDNEAYRLAKFRTEFDNWFNRHYTSIYYVYTFFSLMTDQRAKNMFLTYWPDEIGGTTGHWYPYFYDNDTSWGINNEGQLVFDYYHEDTDYIDGSKVYNGQDSVLWNNFRKTFAQEIRDTYADLRNNNKLTEDKLIKQFITDGSEKWSASVYNEDAEYKYVSLARPEYTGDNKGASELYQVRGDGEHHFKYFVKNRLAYCDSKWYAGTYPTDAVQMRVYTPVVPESTDAQYEQIKKTLEVVPPSADLNIIPYSDMYVSVKFGAQNVTWDSLDLKRVKKGENVLLSAPLDTSGVPMKYNDTETALYGASGLSSLGDLSPLYCGSLKVQAATKLIDLKVGNQTEGYCNLNLKELTVGENTLLKTIDISNCPNLTGALGLSQCSNIEEIYAEGSGITSVELPKSGYLKTLKLPATVTSLVLENQPYIEDLSLQSYRNISQLCIDNCPTLDTVAILNRCRDASGNWTVERVRLTDVSWELEDISFLRTLYPLKGLDTNGANTNDAYLIGKVFVKNITGSEMAEIKSHYPYLDISFETCTATLTFVNVEGQILDQQEVISYNSNGNNGQDPIETGACGTPSKEATAQFYFEYSGWTRVQGGDAELDALWNVVEDRILYPAFNNILRSYPVRFYNNAGTLLSEVVTYYGYDAIYTGDEPIKENTSAPESFAFKEWNPQPVAITGPVNCYAVYVFDDDTWEYVQPGTDFEYTLDQDAMTMQVTKYNLLDKSIVALEDTYEVETKTYTVDTIGGFTDSMVEMIKLPETVKTFETRAFDQSTRLQSITIPESTETIKSLAFGRCEELREVYYNAKNATVVLEPVPSDIGIGSEYPYPFAHSVSNDGFTVYIGKNVKQIPQYMFALYAALSGKRMIRNVEFEDECVIESIGNSAFISADIRNNITFPETLKSIGTYAFANNDGFTEVRLPEGLQSVGASAFSGCEKNKSIYVPATVESIGTRAFNQNSSLQEIRVSVDNKRYKAVDDCLIDTSTGAMLVGCCNSIIPTEVKSFDNYCFAGAKDLVTASIPLGVKTVSTNMFSDCVSLTDVVIPTTVTDISDSAFFNCPKLNLPALISVERIESYAFYGNTTFTEFKCPQNLKSLGASAFRNCTALESFTFNEECKTLKKYSGKTTLFAGCTALKEIHFAYSRDSMIAVWGQEELDTLFGAPNAGQIIVTYTDKELTLYEV